MHGSAASATAFAGMETGLERGRARRFMTGLDPEGQVTIGFRWAEGNSDRLPKLVADLVHGKGDARGEVLRPNNSDCLHGTG
jgi:hypothetical protein